MDVALDLRNLLIPFLSILILNIKILPLAQLQWLPASALLAICEPVLSPFSMSKLFAREYRASVSLATCLIGLPAQKLVQKVNEDQPLKEASFMGRKRFSINERGSVSWP